MMKNNSRDDDDDAKTRATTHYPTTHTHTPHALLLLLKSFLYTTMSMHLNKKTSNQNKSSHHDIQHNFFSFFSCLWKAKLKKNEKLHQHVFMQL